MRHRITIENILSALRGASDDVLRQARSSIIADFVVPGLRHVEMELSKSLRRITIHDLALGPPDRAKSSAARRAGSR
jgi:hypothetical protein